MKTMTFLIALSVTMVTYAQDTMFVHTATTSNISGNVTYLDHPDLNGNPSACLNYVHNWNPDSGTGIYNDNPDGIWYDAGTNRWTIYNENIANMIEGVSFNVYVADEGQCIDHIATAANIDGSSTDIDDPLFNGNNPGPYAFINTYYNPNSVYNTGIWGTYFYTTGNVRSLFEQNNAPVAEGAAFKIAIPGASTTRFTHEATAANISGNYTTIDHPELNGNANATFIFMHYYGVNGTSSNIQLQANTGVWYDGSNWNIYTENLSAMPEGVAFDIAIGENIILDVEEQIMITNVVVYPNPASDILIVETDAIIDSIEIMAVEGRSVQTTKVDALFASIPVESLASGIYLLKTTIGNQIQTTRFIKE